MNGNEYITGRYAEFTSTVEITMLRTSFIRPFIHDFKESIILRFLV